MATFSRMGAIDDAARLRRRGLRLEYATLAWHVVGSVVVLVAAAAARSVALAGFGLDSRIEIVASSTTAFARAGMPCATSTDQRRPRVVWVGCEG